MTIENPGLRFDLDHLPMRRSYQVAVAGESELAVAIEVACEYFPHARQMEQAAAKVHARSGSVLVVRRWGRIVGAAAFLCLNRDGFARLLSGSFPIAEPDEALLAAADEAPAAIYAWMLCVPGNVVAAMGQVMEWLRQPGRRDCDLYACPGSTAGRRFMAKTGFRPSDLALNGNPLWVYRRSTVAPAMEG